jgi:hypothetical protein
MKLKKGSAAAKAFMAKIRAKRKKISGVKETNKIKKAAKKLKVTLPHGYSTTKGKVRVSGLHKDTKSHNVKISVVSGLNVHYSEKLIKLSKELNNWNNVLKNLVIEKKTLAPGMKSVQNMYINDVKNHIKTIKAEISLAKKHIK